MHEVRRGLKDDRVGQLDAASVAGRLDTRLARRDGRFGPDD